MSKLFSIHIQMACRYFSTTHFVSHCDNKDHEHFKECDYPMCNRDLCPVLKAAREGKSFLDRLTKHAVKQRGEEQ